MIKKISIITLGLLLMLSLSATKAVLAGELNSREYGSVDYRDLIGITIDVQAAKAQSTTSSNKSKTEEQQPYIFIRIDKPYEDTTGSAVVDLGENEPLTIPVGDSLDNAPEALDVPDDRPGGDAVTIIISGEEPDEPEPEPEPKPEPEKEPDISIEAPKR